MSNNYEDGLRALNFLKALWIKNHEERLLEGVERGKTANVLGVLKTVLRDKNKLIVGIDKDKPIEEITNSELSEAIFQELKEYE